MSTSNASTLWGGRFSGQPDPTAAAFASSLAVDQRLAAYDIQGSIAHVEMLRSCGHLTAAERTRLVKGLRQLAKSVKAGTFLFSPTYEDVHTAIEVELRKRVGSVADKLHTARSRNDQVALDLRLYLKDWVPKLEQACTRFQRACVTHADRHQDVLMPGYTHLQRAQPVRWSHHLLAYVEMTQRDKDRLQDALKRVDVLPLGSGALAGTSLKTNRRQLAKRLGFSNIAANSLDAVSDRDFVVEIVSALALMAAHHSRLAEEMVLWSSAEFGFIQLPEAFCTGSSLMPQKRNPDTAELIRGQAGRHIGHVVTLLTLLKGLPLAYNRDLQYDKAPLFDAIDTSLVVLELLTKMVRGTKLQRARLREALDDDGLMATDVAEYLVAQGVPFRRAHGVVGRAVQFAESEGRVLSALTLAEWRRFSPAFTPEIQTLFNPRRSVDAKRSLGGTGRSQVHRAIASWKRRLAVGR